MISYHLNTLLSLTNLKNSEIVFETVTIFVIVFPFFFESFNRKKISSWALDFAIDFFSFRINASEVMPLKRKLQRNDRPTDQKVPHLLPFKARLV